MSSAEALPAPAKEKPKVAGQASPLFQPNPSLATNLSNNPFLVGGQSRFVTSSTPPNYILPTPLPAPPALVSAPFINQNLPMGVGPAPFVSSIGAPIYRPVAFQQPLVLLTPQQQLEAAQRQQFFQQLQSYALLSQPKVVPVAQQRSRDYSLDTYFYDAQKVQQESKQKVYVVDELQLIPLQRVSAAAALEQGVPATDGSILAVTVNGAPAPPQTLATNSTQGSQTAMQFRFQDVPRVRLGPEQDSYMSSIAISYSLLSGLLKMDQELQDACRPFDVDEDSIAVTESQLETLIYNVTAKQQNNVKPMLFTFPIADKFMSIPLRLFIFGEVVADPRTGFKKALQTLSPFTWRHALPVGENALRLRGENISASSDEFKARKAYHEFLIKLYSMVWRSLTRLRVEQTALYTTDYSRFAEAALSALKPRSQSVAVLEARVRALAARLQLVHGVFFNTAQFYTPADTLKNIIDPILLSIVARYLYYRL